MQHLDRSPEGPHHLDVKKANNSYVTENIQFLYLPEGFEKELEKVIPQYQYYKFANRPSYFWIRINKKTDYYFDTDVEKTDNEKISLTDKEVFKRQKDDLFNYFWKDETNFYEIESNFSEGEMLKIIENIKILENF